MPDPARRRDIARSYTVTRARRGLEPRDRFRDSHGACAADVERLGARPASAPTDEHPCWCRAPASRHSCPRRDMPNAATARSIVLASGTDVPGEHLAGAAMSTAVRTLVLCVLFVASSAHADVLGPAEPRTDCPRGSRSEEVGSGHGHFAACVPNLAREDWACADGRRIEVVGLELGTRHVGPEWDGRRGPMPPEMESMGTDYVVVEGICDPAPDAAVVESFVMPSGIGSLGAPPAQGVPIGCQRVRVWIPDAGFRCVHPEPAPPPPPPIPPSTAAAPARGPQAACGCSAARPTGPAAAWWTAAMALAFLLRRRRARASTSIVRSAVRDRGATPRSRPSPCRRSGRGWAAPTRHRQFFAALRSAHPGGRAAR